MDGQNLFHAVKAAFGFNFPNYDVAALSASVCRAHDWQLSQVRFYTGVPDAADNASWNRFWTAKLAQMGRQEIHVFSRRLRYRNQTIPLPNGQTTTALVGQEIPARLWRVAMRAQRRRWPKSAQPLSPRLPYSLPAGRRVITANGFVARSLQPHLRGDARCSRLPIRRNYLSRHAPEFFNSLLANPPLHSKPQPFDGREGFTR